MNGMNRGRDIFQRREAPGDGGGGGGGGGDIHWTTTHDGVKDNPKLRESLKGYATPTEAFMHVNRGFGDQWREEMVAHLPEAERADAMTWAQRYKSPKDYFDGSRQAHARARENASLKAPGDKATPEEIAVYRTAMGIPEKPDGYLTDLPNGLVIGEDDKPAMEFFFGEDFHKQPHATKAMAHFLIGRYNQFHDKMTQGRQAADGEDKTAAEDALRTDFGNDYRTNMNVLRNYVEGLPEGVGEILAGARGPDGTGLFNNPVVVKALVGIARELNPGATLMGGGGGGPGASLDDEKASLSKYMREKPKEWAKDLKAKKRYEDVADAILRRDARKPGAKAA